MSRRSAAFRVDLCNAAFRRDRAAPRRREGTFERFTYFDTCLIERLFRAEVLRLLVSKGLISQDVVDNLLSWRHSGFSVHGGVKVSDREAAARLGRYMTRCPVLLERMSIAGPFVWLFVTVDRLLLSSNHLTATIREKGITIRDSFFRGEHERAARNEQDDSGKRILDDDPVVVLPVVEIFGEDHAAAHGAGRLDDGGIPQGDAEAVGGTQRRLHELDVDRRDREPEHEGVDQPNHIVVLETVGPRCSGGLHVKLLQYLSRQAQVTLRQERESNGRLLRFVGRRAQGVEQYVGVNEAHGAGVSRRARAGRRRETARYGP